MNSRIQNQLSALKITRGSAHQHVAVSNAAAGVSFGAFEANTKSVLVSVSGAAVRVRFDGTAPTTTNGIHLGDGYIDVWSAELARVALFIRDDGTDAELDGQPLTY